MTTLRARDRALTCAALLGALLSFAADAGTPDNGTLSSAAPTLTYAPGPFAQSNPSAQAADGPVCNAAATCDSYRLTVTIAPGRLNDRVRVSVSWPEPNSDYDLYIYSGDQGDLDGLTIADVGQSAGSANPEVATFNALPGTSVYTLKVVPFAVTPLEDVTATIELLEDAGGGGGGGGGDSCAVPAGDRP